MAREITVYPKGKATTFTTPYDDATAFGKLKEYTRAGGLLANSTFAKDLVAKSAQYGLSPKQKDWVHKLVVDAENPVAPVQVKAVDFSGIFTIFNNAKKHLKRPKITLQVGTQRVRLSVAGEQSKYPGAVNVTDGEFNGAWFGRINTDGTIFSSRSMTVEIARLIEELAKDPVKVATEYGRLTGCCCFCARTLKDSRSVEVGYGPICADRFGLPWGGKKLTAEELVKAKMVEANADDDADAEEVEAWEAHQMN